jgi:hypothetical protein
MIDPQRDCREKLRLRRRGLRGILDARRQEFQAQQGKRNRSVVREKMARGSGSQPSPLAD